MTTKSDADRVIFSWDTAQDQDHTTLLVATVNSDGTIFVKELLELNPQQILLTYLKIGLLGLKAGFLKLACSMLPKNRKLLEWKLRNWLIRSLMKCE